MEDEYERKLKEAEETKRKAQEDMEKLLKAKEEAHLLELENLQQEMLKEKKGEMMNKVTAKRHQKEAENAVIKNCSA